MRASVVTVAYRAGDQLTRCLDALAERDPEAEVIVVDNGASGDEVDRARDGGATVVSTGENLGFAGGCNLGARAASGEVLVFLNPDTVIGEGAISSLARVLKDETIGVTMPRLRLLDDPDTLNSTGCVIHISGLAWSAGYGLPVSFVDERREIPYANGSALAIRKAVFEEVGGFADPYFIYHEDLELCWKVRMVGLPVVLVPDADVFHDYDYHRHATKNYFMERNRILFVASAYAGRTIALLSPVLLATEVGIWLLALREGWATDKLAGWRWTLRHRGWIRAHRRETQALRRVPDRVLAAYLTPVVDPKMIDVPAPVRLANPLMRAYWAAVRRVL